MWRLHTALAGLEALPEQMAHTCIPCPAVCAPGMVTAWTVCPLFLLPLPCLAGGHEDERHVSHWWGVVWLLLGR